MRRFTQSSRLISGLIMAATVAGPAIGDASEPEVEVQAYSGDVNSPRRIGRRTPLKSGDQLWFHVSPRRDIYFYLADCGPHDGPKLLSEFRDGVRLRRGRKHRVPIRPTVFIRLDDRPGETCLLLMSSRTRLAHPERMADTVESARGPHQGSLRPRTRGYFTEDNGAMRLYADGVSGVAVLRLLLRHR